MPQAKKDNKTPRRWVNCHFFLDVHPAVKSWLIHSQPAGEAIFDNFKRTNRMLALSIDLDLTAQTPPGVERSPICLITGRRTYQILIDPNNKKICEGLAALLYDHFKTSLITWIICSKKNGIPPFKAINSFYQAHGLTDDILDQDTAKKIWQRRKI